MKNSILPRTLRRSLQGFCALGLGCLVVAAQEPPPAAPLPEARPGDAPGLPPPPPVFPTPQDSSLNALTNLPLRLVGPGVFQVGKVKLDQQKRTVSFPAVLNMDQGPMEYFLVTPYGKTHESVLRTDAEPYHIHVAMLLLGATGGGTSGLADDPDAVPPKEDPADRSGQQPAMEPSRERLAGDSLAIEISWQTKDAKPARRRAEELVFNQESRAVPAEGDWVYNGSHVADGIFLAQLGGSIVSLITDSTALVNYVGRGHENDEIWTVNTNRLPPFNTPLQVTFKLEEPGKN